MNDLPETPDSSAKGAAIAPLDHGHFAESACLNCGAVLAGHYCSACGQAAHLHRTFGAFLHDIAHGVLHFDGKTWRTLPMLALRPGRLTRDYIDGHRARYVSPMALFLFAVFLMFAAFQVTGISAPTEIDPEYKVEGPGELMTAQLKRERAELIAERTRNAAGTARRGEIEERIADIDDDLIQANEIPKGLLGGSGLNRAHPGALEARLDHGIEKWRKNPGLMLYKLQSNSYKFSWLLIPLSLPFVALLFLWRRRFGLYDHAVFVTYSIAFMTLLFVVLAIAGTLGTPASVIAPLMVAVPTVHIFAQVRGAYQLRVFSALWRTLALLLFIVVVALLFAAALLALGMTG
ncbi:MAG: DUF3667 domain-containing protein [Candidatus Andeanibacterium colombiense]|uniref:DUF3667 domain-containing protein n=1 Tax=Candidatus Andeanibacterium colombiense TaxID=3121345 RepID=A0AAJ5X4Q6_9SPHN|nr:MAG: DUF3667 domain-containing protein [Sphingomonadaceae bacterium]